MADSGTADGRCRTSTRTPWAPAVGEIMAATDALLFGRRTWQPMAAAWPDRAGDPFADRMNQIPKYVASRTLRQSDLTWSGSTLLPADDGSAHPLELVSATTAATGVLICTYRPADR
jgi:dihydrofolate reductase